MSSSAEHQNQANVTSDEQKNLKKILDSVRESEVLISSKQTNIKNNKNSSNNKSTIADKTKGTSAVNATSLSYLSNEYKKQISIQSASDMNDEFFEGTLNAKDRRQSWSQVHRQRSYIPSLTAICMCYSFFLFILFLFLNNFNQIL